MMSISDHQIIVDGCQYITVNKLCFFDYPSGLECTLYCIQCWMLVHHRSKTGPLWLLMLG